MPEGRWDVKAEEYDELTDKEKRVKVAELCGWEKASQESMEAYWKLGHPKDTWYWMHEFGDVQPIEHLPDYLNDLNACHEFEKGLGNNWEQYEENLNDVMSPDGQEGLSVHATAEQRCRAFVLTMKGGGK